MEQSPPTCYFGRHKRFAYLRSAEHDYAACICVVRKMAGKRLTVSCGTDPTRSNALQPKGGEFNFEVRRPMTLRGSGAVACTASPPSGTAHELHAPEPGHDIQNVVYRDQPATSGQVARTGSAGRDFEVEFAQNLGPDHRDQLTLRVNRKRLRARRVEIVHDTIFRGSVGSRRRARRVPSF